MKGVRLPSSCTLVVLISVLFTGIVQVATFPAETVKKARCYAHCLTLYSSGSPGDGCHSDDCRQCGSACEWISSSVSDCSALCNTSSICRQSCQYINQTIKAWGNIFVGDGSTLQKPQAPTVMHKNVTSLSLSWQPGIQNVSGGVVYLLKKKVVSRDYINEKEYIMVFTEPSAILTTKQVCESVTIDSTIWPKPRSFLFTVFALTENSTLVEGPESSRIEMTKPGAVKEITFPVFKYYKNSSVNKLELTTSIIPSDQSRFATNYGIRWQIREMNCQNPYVNPRMNNIVKDISKVSLRLYEKLVTCEHSLEVYQQVECVAGVVKTKYYKYPGCQNISSFDKEYCYQFDPPPTPASSRAVGNLTRTDLKTTRDFRFKTTITWQTPTYPYVKPSSYDLDFGDADNVIEIGPQIYWNPDRQESGITDTSFPLSELYPNIKYKARVMPFFPTNYKVKREANELIFRTPALPRNELAVQDIQVSQSFSSSGHYSYNISWRKELFDYGTFQGYAYNLTDGNVTRRNITRDKFVIIDRLGHSETRTFQVKPTYSENWIKGESLTKVLRSPDPIEDQLKVGFLKQEGDAVENKKNNTYSIVVSWKPPSFQYKAVDYYRLSYSLSGYPEFACDKSNGNRCRPVQTNKTHYTLSGILPRESIAFTVQPVFRNSPYVQGISTTTQIDAPFPRRDLVAVRNLTNIEHHPLNYTNETSFSWETPLFKHSAVKRYAIKYIVVALDKTSSNQNTVVRRSVQANGTNTILETSTTGTIFSVPKLKDGQKLTFQVTPVFTRGIIVGEKKEIVISKPTLPNSKTNQLTTAQRAGLIIGILLLLLLAILLIVWFVRRRQRLLKEGRLVGANGALIDHWEVPIDKICLEEELGEGAFGKVFKGMLVELPEQSAKYSIAKSIRRKSIKPLYPEDGYIVAIKMLHDFADIDQRKEFLKEIQLMKDVGCHRNIVNMLGCGTFSEPMFLIVEYLPNGDLLHYLRKRRGKASQYPDSDPRGPYHSTYCQTYFNKNNPDGGISLQPSRSDRVYVHTPEPQKESKNGEIQLVSMQRKENPDIQDDDNTGKEHQPDNNGEQEIKQDDEDDVLTSGDLMAFAWQVSQGMEYLSKRGYVHRDLAARNVLVGNSKEAKIADFGLTRHMYEDLYQAKTNRKLPLKWMSIEAIFDQSFTSQSDVWAYGVFLWELVTLGGTPYPSINNRELLKLLKEGYRMEKPETCDTELYNIMCSCWKEKPEDRPTFVDLREKLEEMMTRDNPYFDPTAVDESRDYYNVPSFNSASEPGDDDDITEVIIGEASSPREENKEDTNKNTISAPDNNRNGLNFENLSFNDNEEDLELDQVVFDNEKTDNTTPSKADQKNLKYAKLDFEDIEFQLYRRQNHGYAL